MKHLLSYLLLYIIALQGILGQDVYEIDPKYPVHDLNSSLKVYADSTDAFSPEFILKDSQLPFQLGNTLPKYLSVGVTYWGKITVRAKDSLTGWTLHFEDDRIGIPAWAKSNGKVDLYGYINSKRVFHKKTGVEYPKNERDINANWVLNQISLDDIPLRQNITLIIRAEGHSMGHPAYFNLRARSPQQPYYHQIYQFHNSFNIFMFGVTFIIFLYHILQYIYLKESVFMWFSIWLLFCTLTMAMSVGLVIGSFTEFRFPLWVIIANGVFFSFWFFGRAFINSKEKFPKLDKFILGLAVFILVEIIGVALYAILFNPQIFFTGVGIHYNLLQIYTVASLIMSIILAFKKDLFARYFGIGSIIGSIFLIIGTLWAMQVIMVSGKNFIDPFATGMFLQIVIYSFGIAYRRQKINEKSQERQLQAERSVAEVLRMKDLDKIKTRFFANISHEFRTPLSLITGPLQQAKNLSNKKSTDEVVLSDKAFNIIKKNTSRLQMLVDQLLDLSKIESGNVRLNLKKGGLIQFARSIVFSFESMAERQNISLNTHFSDEMDDAYYDKDKFEKIITNLLSNAFKFTPSGGVINANVTKNGNHFTLEISDTGKGIKQEEIDRIFDRFYRVEGTEAKGSGIGLALTKELVDLQNGKISVHSEKGRGTTFKVRLPITLDQLPDSVVIKNDNELNAITTSEVVNKQNDKVVSEVLHHENVVLLVEDNQDLQDFISEILRGQYTVFTADDGLQGERMAFEHIPDLVISDVMMPKKDGYELCNSLKSNIKTSHIPIIMLTAKAGQSNKIAGLTQGAEAYLTKPFDSDELLLRVKNLIEARKKIWEHFKSLDLALIDDLDLKSADDTFLQKVAKTIKDNLDNDLLSVEDIASKVGFSRAQLHRKLKALTNKSTGQLISEIRLNEAKIMLEKNVGTVSEIAYSVGYSNMSYFTKSFKEKFGILPSKV
jgi:signal transduction histidine kinase/DNA-binding response OmpR family regulator